MKIKHYDLSSDIPDEYLPSLVDSEIECWGSEPFSEYMICIDCKRVYSIEDVYSSVENYRNRKIDKQFECECGSETTFMYPKDKYLDLLINYFKGEVITSLLIDNNNVEGFGISTKNTLKNIVYNEMDCRPNSYDKDNIIKLISQKVFNINNGGNKDFLYSNQIYITPSYRQGNVSFDLLKMIFNLNKDRYDNLPIVGETKYESKFYPLSRIMGYTNICSDKYGNVLQYCKSVKDVTSIFNNYDSFSDKRLIRKIFKYKKESKLILKNNPHFLEKKFYK